ncbi:EpsG family protein [Capnocytophaga canis]|uniref:EpsG family protein n=1 Tax=Capnocytophaga canis TaxID=1848903 RepID=UPI0037D8FB0C
MGKKKIVMFPGGWYIFLYVSLILSIFVSKIYRSRVVLYIFVMLLICFSGFRYNAGIDYFEYERLVYSDDLLLRIEPFSSYFLLLSRKYNAAWIFFFFTSLIYVLSIFLGLIRFKVFGAISTFLFTTFTISFLTSFGFVRQFVASGLVFLALSFLYYRKSIHYIILVIIASLFHVSAIVYLPIVFINKFVRKKVNFFTFLLLIPISFSFTSVFVFIIDKIGLFYEYFDKVGGGEVSGKKIYYSLLVIFIFVSFLQQKIVTKESNLMYYSQNMSFVGLFIYGAFFNFGEHIARISYYFMPFHFVWFFYLYKNILSKHVKILFLYFLFIVGTFYFYATLYYAQFTDRGDVMNEMEIIFFRNK